MTHLNPSRRFNRKQLLAGGAILLSLGLFVDLRGLPSLGAKTAAASCPLASSSQGQLSKQQVAKLLTVAEGDQKVKIREIAHEPSCKLPSLQVRSGSMAEREVYSLEGFAPQMWIVVLYEGDQYAGYKFWFR